jgi:hypothetical protein
MGIGDAYLGLVDLLSHNGKRCLCFLKSACVEQLLT